jgi:hypothetical protein
MIVREIWKNTSTSWDKVKTAYPRWAFNKKPHFLAGIRRPRSTLCACLAHGYATTLFLADESVNHGSNHFIEVVAQTLEDRRSSEC